MKKYIKDPLNPLRPMHYFEYCENIHRRDQDVAWEKEHKPDADIEKAKVEKKASAAKGELEASKKSATEAMDKGDLPTAELALPRPKMFPSTSS